MLMHALPEPSYPALRRMKPGESQVFAGGRRARSKVTTIQRRAGGQFTQTAVVIADPKAEWCKKGTLVFCQREIPKTRKWST